MSFAKMAEPMEMPFGIWTRGGSKEPRIRWVSRSSHAKA